MAASNEYVQLGAATSGQWDLELDALSTDGSRKFLTLESRAAYLRLEIEGYPTVRELLRFMESTLGTRNQAQMMLGKCLRVPVFVVKDSEYPDRYFIKLCGNTTTCQLTVAGVEAEDLLLSVRQLACDLPE